MIFDRKDNSCFDPDKDSYLGTLCEQYSSLSEEEKKEFMEKLNGPKERAIDPSKLKWFLDKAGQIKSLIKECTTEFKFDININDSRDAVVEVVLLQMDLDDVRKLRIVCDGCKFFEIVITDNGYLKISFSFDVIIKVGGKLL